MVTSIKPITVGELLDALEGADRNESITLIANINNENYVEGKGFSCPIGCVTKLEVKPGKFDWIIEQGKPYVIAECERRGLM